VRVLAEDFPSESKGTGGEGGFWKNQYGLDASEGKKKGLDTSERMLRKKKVYTEGGEHSGGVGGAHEVCEQLEGWGKKMVFKEETLIARLAGLRDE